MSIPVYSPSSGWWNNMPTVWINPYTHMPYQLLAGNGYQLLAGDGMVHRFQSNAVLLPAAAPEPTTPDFLAITRDIANG